MRNKNYEFNFANAQKSSSETPYTPEIRDPVLAEISELLQSPGGRTIAGLCDHLVLGDVACRRYIRQIINMGGQVDMAIDGKSGEKRFYLKSYARPDPP